MRALLGLLLVAAACTARAQDTEWRVPFISTPGEVVERMLELAGTHADDYVVDLGSGDGRIVIAAARRYGARGLGIELDDALVRAFADRQAAVEAALAGSARSSRINDARTAALR